MEMHVNDLVTIFDKKHNTRIIYDLPTLARQIAERGRVTDPVHVFASGTEKDFEKAKNKTALLARGAKGFRRVHAAQYLLDHPDEFPETSFSGHIPVIVLFGYSEREQIDYTLDHAEQRGLDSIEQLEMLRHMLGCGTPYTEAECISKMHPILYMSATQSTREKLDKLLSDRNKLSNPIKDRQAVEKILLNFWRGRFQRMKRIVTDTTGVLFANERALAYGERTDFEPVALSGKDIADISKKGITASARMLEILDDKRQQKITGKKDSGKPWSQKVIADKLPIYGQSKRFATILKAIQGDEAAQALLPEIRDIMILEEKCAEKKGSDYRDYLSC